MTIDTIRFEVHQNESYITFENLKYWYETFMNQKGAELVQMQVDGYETSQLQGTTKDYMNLAPIEKMKLGNVYQLPNGDLKIVKASVNMDFGSHTYGIVVQYNKTPDGKTDRFVFELSIPKYWFGHNIFEARFFDLAFKKEEKEVYRDNYRWITGTLSSMFNYLNCEYDLRDIRITRLDLCRNEYNHNKITVQNKIFTIKCDVLRYSRMSVSPVRDTVWINNKSDKWITKVYNKGTEFTAHDLPRLNSRKEHDTEILKELAEKTLRYELGMHNKGLAKLFKEDILFTKNKELHLLYHKYLKLHQWYVSRRQKARGLLKEGRIERPLKGYEIVYYVLEENVWKYQKIERTSNTYVTIQVDGEEYKMKLDRYNIDLANSVRNYHESVFKIYASRPTSDREKEEKKDLLFGCSGHFYSIEDQLIHSMKTLDTIHMDEDIIQYYCQIVSKRFIKFLHADNNYTSHQIRGIIQHQPRTNLKQTTVDKCRIIIEKLLEHDEIRDSVDRREYALKAINDLNQPGEIWHRWRKRIRQLWGIDIDKDVHLQQYIFEDSFQSTMNMYIAQYGGRVLGKHFRHNEYKQMCL